MTLFPSVRMVALSLVLTLSLVSGSGFCRGEEKPVAPVLKKVPGLAFYAPM